MPRKRKNPTLGERIKKARVQAGLSQKDMGKHLKISDKAVSAYEVDRAEPSIDAIRKIGKLTNRSFSYFIDDFTEGDIDLQAKLESIERELKAVKEMLGKRS